MGESQGYVSAIGRGWKTIVLAGIIACATALAVAFLMPMTYESEARLLVSQSGTAIDIFGTQLSDGAVPSDNPVQTQAELLRSRTLIAEVIHRLDLKVTPEELARRIEVSPIGPTSVISITVHDSNGKTAADIANTIASVYLANARASRQTSLKVAANALATRIAGVKAELTALDKAAGSADLATERRIAADRLAKLSDTLEQLRVAQQLGASWGIVTDAAIPAAKPTGPTPLTAGLGGLLAGLLIGTVLVIGQEARGSRPLPARDAQPEPDPQYDSRMRRGA